jgi:hypothetical protein
MQKQVVQVTMNIGANAEIWKINALVSTSVDRNTINDIRTGKPVGHGAEQVTM